MSLRKETPCNFGPCPYDAEYYHTCAYYCSESEPEDYPEEDYEDEEYPGDYDDCDYEVGYDPYMGCSTDDC